MSRTRTVHRCRDCGGTSPNWLGRCPDCGAWNSLEQQSEQPAAPSGWRVPSTPSRPVPISEVDVERCRPLATGLAELDRVLGGGLVPGSVSLFGGEPGIGKSTLLLQALAALASRGASTLLVTAEESAHQVRLRAERLGTLAPGLQLVAEATLPAILGHLGEVAPDVVVIDSIQTIFDPEIGSVPGSVTQVTECAHRLVLAAKELGVSVVLVGHVTKEGSLAGPRVLEHLVDTVLSFEGDRHHALRLLRAVKHRFGSAEELGIFEMGEQGLVGVPDASGLLLADRRGGVPGSVVAPTMDGGRPLLVEIQALVSPSSLAQPRRSAQGLDHGRLTLLLAVLARRVGIGAFGTSDVHASAVGGVRVAEPGADLALALSLVSSQLDVALADDLVAVGEVGLGGELRQAPQLPRRLAEAARLGFRRAVVPTSTPPGPPGLELVRASTLVEALGRLGL